MMISKVEQNTAAWTALNVLLPSRTPDEDYWWKQSGPQLAALVEGAGYAPEKQYEALLFHYHWMVSWLICCDPVCVFVSKKTAGALHGPIALGGRRPKEVEIAIATRWNAHWIFVEVEHYADPA